MSEKTVILADETYTSVPRPTGPIRRTARIPTAFLQALLKTADQGDAIEVPLKGRDAAKVARALYNAVKPHGYKAQVRTQTDTLTVWAEKRPAGTRLQEAK